MRDLPPRIEQIRSWKEANPNIYIHVEMGSFQSQKIARHFLRLLEKADSLGLNEDELETAAGECSYPDLSHHLHPPILQGASGKRGCQKAAGLREHLGMSGSFQPGTS